MVHAYHTGTMRRLAPFLVVSVLVATTSCERTGFHPPAAGAGGTMALGGVPVTGGASAAGGTVGTGGLSAGGMIGGGGAPVGGASAGGASISTGGASGGASGTNGCAQLGDDHCVAECLVEYALVDNAICTNGAWSCRSGYVLASSCPVGACGVTPDACCDLTTGIVTVNPCTTSGLRGPCPDGNVETYHEQAWCVPQTLAGGTCISLDRQPCTGPAVGCSDLSGGIVTCGCSGSGSDASVGTWQCSSYIGP